MHREPYNVAYHYWRKTMSDTPRVDEFCKTSGGQYTYDISGLARHLERELAAAQAERDELRKERDDLQVGFKQACHNIAELVRERDELRRRDGGK